MLMMQMMTPALQRALTTTREQSTIADYLFLEAWERAPSDNAGHALRVVQIRRANPDLAAAIRAEIEAEALERRAKSKVKTSSN